MRIIEIVADAGHHDTLTGIAEQYEVTDVWCGLPGVDARLVLRMLVDDESRQAVLDALQSILGTSDDTRIVVLPVDAVLPRVQDDEEYSVAMTREELYSQIEKGTRVDDNYLLLTVLSTTVAAIGLIEDNVAVVIGAMVISPLLGPVIALAFASSLGDRRLLLDASRTALVGLGLAFLLIQIRPVYLARESLSENLGLPVLGAVSMVRTTGQILRRRFELFSFILVAGMLLATAGGAVYFQDSGVRIAQMMMR